MDGFVELAVINEFFFYPRNYRCIPDPTSEYHLIFLTSTSAQRYAEFEAGIKNEYSIFIDKIEFDYFNLNRIED